MANHVIQRQVLDVTFSEKEKAKTEQSAIRKMFYDQLFPVMEVILDKHDIRNQHIIIDQLKLDLGNISLKTPTEEIKQLIAKVLEDQLLSQIDTHYEGDYDRGVTLSRIQDQEDSFVKSFKKILEKAGRIVQQHVLDLPLAKQEDINQTQAIIKKLFREKLYPEIEKVLDQLGIDDKQMLLHRLEIDLRLLLPIDYSGETRRKIAALLEERLISFLKPYIAGNQGEQFLAALRTSSGSALKRIKKSTLREGRISTHEAPHKHPGKAKILSSMEAHIRLIRHFLTNGVLPWNAPTVISVEAQIETALNKYPTALKQLLSNEISKNQIRQRLVFHLSNAMIYRVAGLYIGDESKAIGKLVEELITLQQKAGVVNMSSRHWRNLVMNVLLHQVATNTSQGSKSLNLVHTILHKAETKTAEPLQNKVEKAINKLKKEGTSFSSELPEVVEQLQEVIPKNSSIKKPIKKEPFDPAYMLSKLPRKKSWFRKRLEQILSFLPQKWKTWLLPEPHIAPLPPPALATETPMRKSLEDYTSSDGSIYIENAGLVLTWPYLSILFKELGLVEDNEFINDDARSKAVVLLEFLASENQEPEEYALALPKILCDIPLQDPVDSEISLTQREQSEAVELLEAVIKNWSALGSTSVEGMRTGFLQREGRLVKKDEGWTLTVEQQTIDLLLDQLPWGINLVRLPWMEEALHVEW